MPESKSSGKKSETPRVALWERYFGDLYNSVWHRRKAILLSSFVVVVAVFAAYSSSNVSEDDLARWRQDLQQRSEKLAASLADWLEQNPAFQTHSKGEIGWMSTSSVFADVSASTTNVTSDFVRLFWNDAVSMQDLIPARRDELTFLLVPGLFTQWYPGYMSHNLKTLHDLGLSVEIARLNTDVGVERNAEHLKRTVERIHHSTGRKVVLFCHSKGALDAAAMLSIFPETVPMVAALVAAQAPYGGATLVNDLMHTDHRKRATLSVVESLLAGDKAALEDLSYDARKSFLTQHRYPIERVSTISLAASADNMRLSLLKPTVDYVNFRYSEPNDGCVSRKDAYIPGGKVVYISDMDHFGPAYHGFPALDSYDPARMLLVLLKLAQA